METLSQRKRKSKGKWFANPKKARYNICPGQRGFLIFCNNREKEAIKEARSLFDEFSPKFQDAEDDNLVENDTEPTNTLVEDTTNKSDSEEEEDVFDSLEKETNKLKSEAKDDNGEKFKLMQTGVQNVLFFKTKLKDPVKFALTILNDIKTTGEQRTRFIMRLVPIEATCKAYEDNVKEVMQKLALKHFKADDAKKSYAILFKSRCNQDFTKEIAIKAINSVIKTVSPEATVEYKTPDLVIMVEVMKGNCCLGILPDYYGYKKYNLIELASAASDKKTVVAKPDLNEEAIATKLELNKDTSENDTKHDESITTVVKNEVDE